MIVYYLLFITFLVTAALNMLRVHAGFFTNYAADRGQSALLASRSVSRAI
jgi:hypothetical protein